MINSKTRENLQGSAVKCGGNHDSIFFNISKKITQKCIRELIQLNQKIKYS